MAQVTQLDVGLFEQAVKAADAMFLVTPLPPDLGDEVDLRIVALNDAGVAVLAQPGGLHESTLRASFTPEARHQLREILLPALADRVPSTHELQLPNGEVLGWWELRLHPTADGVLAVATEITSRHDASTEAQDRYRLLAEHATEVILLAGADNAYTWVSPSATELLGWLPEEMVGLGTVDFVSPEDYERVLAVRRTQGAAVAGLDPLRFRCKDGSYALVSTRSRLLTDVTGNITGRVVALLDARSEVEARAALADSEARFRLLAENASDVVYQTDTDGTVQWVSPSIENVLGWRVQQFVGTRAVDFVSPDDLDRAYSGRSKVYDGHAVKDIEVRFRCTNGELRWMSVQGRPLYDEHGVIVASVVGMRDCQAEVIARRALNTLSAGTSTLLHADHEDQLLEDMCRAAVDKGGYLYAWYGRAVHDEVKSVQRVASAGPHDSYLDTVRIVWDEQSRFGQGPTGVALRECRVTIAADLQSLPMFTPWRDAALAHGFRSSLSLPVCVDGRIDGAFMVYAAEPLAFDDSAVALLTDLAGQVGYGLQRLRDDARLRVARKEQMLLTAAVEQAAESVVITDVSGSIIYANPSAVRTTGYSLDELRGQNPRVSKSGLHDRNFYDGLWSRLLGGLAWHGLMVNRRKDGTLYEEDVTIAPIHDANGERIAFVAVKHDLSAERRLEADLDRRADDREVMLSVMSQVRPANSLAATALALCETIRDLTAFDTAGIWLAQDDGSFRMIGFAGDVPDDLRVVPVRLRDTEGALADLSVRARSVDLADPGVGDRLGEQLRTRLSAAGYTALGFGAITSAGALVGALVVGTRAATGPTDLTIRRTLLEELGSFAGTLIAPQLDQDERAATLRADITDIIARRLFHPVFQPIVDLATHQIMGYEALSRFDDGTPPDVRIAGAHAIGHGVELEIECAREALLQARGLPRNVWVSINLSPAAVISGEARALTDDLDHECIVEITEHSPIENYQALRRALRLLSRLKVSVDDAGAGFASLRHILELKPDFVKLDIALVRGIDSDPARQALAVGMCHFAARTGAVLIAEGIETKAEAETLRGLGVPFGQGYLFGRPEPIA